jgi:fibronectin-binding autotransporter adhesin
VTQSTTRFPPTLTFGDRAGSKTGVANYLPGNDIDVGANGGSDQPSASFTVNTLRFNGEDTLYLSGINTISTGGILITDNAFEDNIDGGALRAGAGQELVLINYGVGPVTLSSQLVDASSGPSGVTYLGTTGNTILSGQNTYTGVTTINGDIVTLGSAEITGTSGPLGDSPAVNPGSILFNGGTLQYSSANHFDYSGRFSTAADQDISIDTNGQTVTFSTSLSSSNGSLTLTDSSRAPQIAVNDQYDISADETTRSMLILTGNNTYTGRTTIGGGLLLFDNQDSFYGYSPSNGLGDQYLVNEAPNLTVQSGGGVGFGVGGAGQFTSADVSAILSNAVFQNGNTTIAFDTSDVFNQSSNSYLYLGYHTEDIPGNTFIYTGAVSDPAGASTRNLTELGNGLVTLTGSVGYSGITNIDGGALSMDFSASTTSQTGASGDLVFKDGGGFYLISSTDTNVSASRSFTSTTLNPGAYFIGASSGASGIGGAASLNVGPIYREVGATINFEVPVSGAIETAGLYQILDFPNPYVADVGIRTYQQTPISFATVNGDDWAAFSGSIVVPAASVPGYYTPSTSSALSGNADIAFGVSNTTLAAVTGTTAINNLRFNQPQSTTINVDGTLVTGGILVTPAVGNHVTTITEGALQSIAIPYFQNYTADSNGQTGLNFDSDLVIIQDNGTAPLIIGCNIMDTPYPPQFSGPDIEPLYTPSALTKSGVGTVVLEGVDSYSAGTYINQGILQFANESAFQNDFTPVYYGFSLPLAPVYVAPGATLAINVGGAGEFSNSDVEIILAKVSFGKDSFFGFDTSDAPGGFFNLTQVLADTNGGANPLGITKLGANSLVLDEDNTYTGPTMVVSGTLQAGISSSTGSSPVSGPFGNNSQVILSDNQGTALNIEGFSVQIGSLTGGGTAGGSVLVAGGTLAIGGDNTSPPAFAGSISGPGELTKIGSGTLALSGVNAFTGTTLVQGGILQYTQEASLYDNNSGYWNGANIIVDGGAILAFNVGGTGEFTSSDIGLIAANAGFQNGSVIALDTTNATGGDFVFGGVIADSENGANSLGLTKLGSGTLTLTGNNTYTGPTTVIDGSIVVNGNGTLGSGPVIIGGVAFGNVNPAVLQFGDNSSASYDSLTANGSEIYDGAGGGMIFSNRATAGNSTLTANGGANGGLGGAIYFRDTSTGGDATVKVYGNALLDISEDGNPIVTIGSIEGSGNVFLGANDLSFGANNSTTVFSGLIQDVGGSQSVSGGSLIKVGTGSLTLTGSISTAGTVTVSAGAIKVDGDGSTTFGSINAGGVFVDGAATSNGSGGTLEFHDSASAAASGHFSLTVDGGAVPGAPRGLDGILRRIQRRGRGAHRDGRIRLRRFRRPPGIR